MKSTSSQQSNKDQTNKTPEQQMKEAGVSQDTISLIMRIALGSGQVSASDMKQLMLVLPNLPDVALQFLSVHMDAINAAIKSVNAPQNNNQEESVFAQTITYGSAENYNPLGIGQIAFIDKLPDGAKAVSISDLFIENKKSIEDKKLNSDDSFNPAPNWFDTWLSMVENNLFLEIQKQDGKSQYCSPKMIDLQVNQRSSDKNLRMANIEQILVELMSIRSQGSVTILSESQALEALKTNLGNQDSKDSSKTNLGNQHSKDSSKTNLGNQDSKDSSKTNLGNQDSKDSSKTNLGNQHSKDSSKTNLGNQDSSKSWVNQVLHNQNSPSEESVASVASVLGYETRSWRDLVTSQNNSSEQNKSSDRGR
jgi:hypothetical protein